MRGHTVRVYNMYYTTSDGEDGYDVIEAPTEKQAEYYANELCSMNKWNLRYMELAQNRYCISA